MVMLGASTPHDFMPLKSDMNRIHKRVFPTVEEEKRHQLHLGRFQQFTSNLCERVRQLPINSNYKIVKVLPTNEEKEQKERAKIQEEAARMWKEVMQKETNNVATTEENNEEEQKLSAERIFREVVEKEKGAVEKEEQKAQIEEEA